MKDFLRDDAGAVEGVVEPEVGRQGMMRDRGDDAVFEGVGGFEAEDADGFDADVLIGWGVDDGGIRVVGDGAGEDVGGAAPGVGKSSSLILTRAWTSLRLSPLASKRMWVSRSSISAGILGPDFSADLSWFFSGGFSVGFWDAFRSARGEAGLVLREQRAAATQSAEREVRVSFTMASQAV